MRTTGWYCVILATGLMTGLLSLQHIVRGSDKGRAEIPAATHCPNYRIFPSNATQTETFIVRHPTNPSILFASANTIASSGFISEGVYVTTNGGASWYGSDTCKGAPIPFHNGDPGIAIDKDGRFVLIRLGPPLSLPGLYSHYSTDLGVTWSNQRTVATEQQDRATLVSDVNPSSPFYGRTYAVWVRFSPPYPVVYARTDDGASTWTAPAQINNPTPRCAGGEVAMGPNGVVNVCWARVIESSPFTEDYAGFASSSNGGATWTVLENAFDMNGIAGDFPSKSGIRVNGLPRLDVDKSGGPRNGWIYVATTQRALAPAGSDPDIILNRSTDGGATWSAGIRVNQDPLNNGKFQFFPAVHVDDFGGVNVLFYDDRNTTSDSSGVFLARSLDGGNTWSEHEISDHNFKPQPLVSGLGQGYQGDNIGLTSVGTTLWPVWMDNSSGIYQLWTAPCDITTLSVGEPRNVPPDRFRLEQNFPNPFNPATTIEYSLSQADHVILTVFDMNGKEIATLVNERQPAGTYRVEFSADGLSLASGTYYYQLRGSTFSTIKPMVLLK